MRLVGAQDELERLQRNAAGPRVVKMAPKQPVNEATRREFDAARRILQELTLPWEPLFRAIESSLDKQTALLAIEPDAGKGMVRITGEARDYLAILAFMRRLEQAGALVAVHLLNHQIREDVAERPYQFILAASWRTAP
jgi:Tfp pilus assembly protein PilN